jgi:tRNA-binding EMAP/Myf-like protein
MLRYLEKIDVGEAEPRQVSISRCYFALIAAIQQPLNFAQVLSGLAGKIPLDTMAGRRVVVICNLKPAKMRGLFSYAMIFAASSEWNFGAPCVFVNACAGEDDKTVELVTPPAAAQVGERVTVEGFAQSPAAAELSMKV